MKTELKAKLLQHLVRRKKNDKGFTLIELLVVIIIIGILAAIALPSFLNQASKARQAEAKQTLGALTRGQQAYRLENPQFAPAIADLALGVQSTTNNYDYGDALVTGDARIPDANKGIFSTGISGSTLNTYSQIFADAVDHVAVKDYVGATAASQDGAGNATTITVLCESQKPTGQDATKIVAGTYTATATPPELGCNLTTSKKL